MSYVSDARSALIANYPDAYPDAGGAETAEEERLIDLYALLVLTTGEETTLEDVHEAWGVWRSRAAPDHKSLVPFEELAYEVRENDRPYAEAIRAAAKTIRR